MYLGKQVRDRSRCSADCSQIPKVFEGRAERLYELFDDYSAAVTAARAAGREAKSDNAVLRTGVSLARAQRDVTRDLTVFRKEAGRLGADLGLPTGKPKSTQNFLGLILVEQRKQTRA